MVIVLITLAVLGWLLSIAGTVSTHRGAARIGRDEDDVPYIAQFSSGGKAGMWLAVGGATAGLVCTVLAVLSA